MAAADNALLDVVEDKVLGTRYVEELLALVDSGVSNDTSHLVADRERRRAEVERLVGSIAAGVPADSVAPAIRGREAEIAKLDARLHLPREAPPDIERLRRALTARAAEWRQTLRDEPKVARLLLRRLLGPLTLWDSSEPGEAWVNWEASLTPALLDGLAPIHHVASPTGLATEVPIGGPLPVAA